MLANFKMCCGPPYTVLYVTSYIVVLNIYNKVYALHCAVVINNHHSICRFLVYALHCAIIINSEVSGFRPYLYHRYKYCSNSLFSGVRPALCFCYKHHSIRRFLVHALPCASVISITQFEGFCV